MDNLTLETLPNAVSKLFEKVSNIESLLRSQVSQPETDNWLSLENLVEYLPGNPAKATIYGYVHRREIPHKKLGKRLMFLKSEIDIWLKSKTRKTIHEIEEEASNLLSKN